MLLFLTLFAIVLLMQCIAWGGSRTLGQLFSRRFAAVDGLELKSAFSILLQFHRLRRISRLYAAPSSVHRTDNCLLIAAWSTGPSLPPDMSNAPPAQRENDLSVFQFYDWVLQNR